MDVLRKPLADLPDPLPLPPPRLSRAGGKPLAFDRNVRPPGSKSLTNRALLLAALADGTSVIRRALVDADDAQRMVAALRQLGATVDVRGDEITVTGVGGRWHVPPEGSTVNLNNAGTATRFLAAASLLAPAPITIDGNARMRERPIAELCEILEELGAEIEYQGKGGCPPVRITPPLPAEFAPGVIEIPTTRSSQFVSGLLLAAPWMPSGITIKLVGEITSESYVQMTVGLLQRLGAAVRASGDHRVIRVGRGVKAFEYEVEPDASGATYFWAAAALIEGAVCRVLGLDGTSLQGDSDFPELLSRMGVSTAARSATGAATGPGLTESFIETRGPGVLSGLMADMSNMPDAAMTLAVVASFAKGPSVLRGLKTLRVKESDRIAAMQEQLAKIGVKVESPVAGDVGAMTITPPAGGVDCSPTCPPVYFDTYDDHRIAMSLALVALRRPNVFINDPKCVAKTYAGFWADFVGLWG
jgi:3-phosphoshikimate 1-carboxyvinyltransferase